MFNVAGYNVAAECGRSAASSVAIAALHASINRGSSGVANLVLFLDR
jgi:hypothetical protein